MSDHPPTSGARDKVDALAATLLTRRDAGWSPTEAAEFALWRAADPRHEAAVHRIESAQRLLTRLPESPSTAAMLAELDSLYAPRPRTRPWLFPVAALAAAAGLAFAVWSFVPRPAPPATLSFVAAAGEARKVPLADGSVLLLNGASRVDVEFVAAERRVSLREGEVHCAVAKDEARPFIVTAGTVHVRAVGTAFNVRRESAAVEVVVTEGKVRVTRDAATKADAREPLLLFAGEATWIGLASGDPMMTASRLSNEAMRGKLAWQAPRLEFNNTPLAEALARFNRFSRVQIEIGDPELGTRPVGGTFNADNAETFVNLLRLGDDFRVEKVSETRLVLRKAR